MSDVTFTVPFVRGKARVRFSRTGHTYTPTGTENAMGDIQMAYRAAAGSKCAPEGAPVSVFISTIRAMPKSRPKKAGDEEPDVYKPDVDNVAKLVLDALNGVAWHDDTQVTMLNVSKGMRRRDLDDQTRVHIMWGDGR